jgi:hypothetical protein
LVVDPLTGVEGRAQVIAPDLWHGAPEQEISIAIQSGGLLRIQCVDLAGLRTITHGARQSPARIKTNLQSLVRVSVRASFTSSVLLVEPSTIPPILTNQEAARCRTAHHGAG